MATDGLFIVILHDENGIVINGPAILSPTVAMLKPKAADRRAKPSTDWYVAKGERAAILRKTHGKRWENLDPVSFPSRDVLAYQWSDTRIDGTYPDWRKTIEKTPSPNLPIPAFDYRLLAPLAHAICGDPKRAGTVKLSATGTKMDPIMVFGHGNMGEASLAFGVIMPVRDDLKADIPSWVKP